MKDRRAPKEGAKVPERTCRECYQEYTPSSRDDGFCSDYCKEQFDKGLMGEED